MTEQDEKRRDELDLLWARATQESVKDGEVFTRYHFAAMVCAEKDAEIERYKRIESKVQSHITDIEQRLSEANAAIAMKDEALKMLHFAYLPDGHCAPHDCFSTGPRTGDPILDYVSCPGCAAEHMYNASISASSSTVAKWEAEKLLPLQRQVAMLRAMFAELAEHQADCDVFDLDENDCHKECTCGYSLTLSNTQATAEAYEKGLAAKVLKKVESNDLQKELAKRNFVSMPKSVYELIRRNANARADAISW